jgi:hypothetical protein
VNAFLDLADRQISAPVKTRHRAVERRAETRANKSDEERRDLLKEWRAWRRQQIDDALAGSHGEDMAALLAHLKGITRWNEIDPDVILAAWRAADADTQFIARRLVRDHIVDLRVGVGLVPFDDMPLPF